MVGFMMFLVYFIISAVSALFTIKGTQRWHKKYLELDSQHVETRLRYLRLQEDFHNYQMRMMTVRPGPIVRDYRPDMPMLENEETATLFLSKLYQLALIGRIQPIRAALLDWNKKHVLNANKGD